MAIILEIFLKITCLLLTWGLKDLEFLNYREKQIDELIEMFNNREINEKYNRLRKIEHVFH